MFKIPKPKPQTIIEKEKCQWCGKGYIDLGRHKCKLDPANQIHIGEPTATETEASTITITQYIEKLQEYIKPLLEKHPQYRNHYNALIKAEKNAKWQYQLIEKTIQFLKEMGYLS